MANRKLTLEVDAETSKAQRKLKGLNADGGSLPGGDSISRSSDKAAKSLEKLDKSTSNLDSRMATVTRAFAGMATGLAVSYASRYFDEGSKGRSAMEYGGSALMGASAGAQAGKVFGPKGMVAGALLGTGLMVGKTYMDKEGATKDALKDFDKNERIYAGVKAWQTKLAELTKVMDKDEITTILANLKKTESTFKGRATDAIKGGRMEEAADYTRNLGDVRSRQAQLESLLKQDRKPEFRGDMGGTDSLARMGAGFGGSGDTGRAIADSTARSVELLKSIDSKTKSNGGGAWL